MKMRRVVMAGMAGVLCVWLASCPGDTPSQPRQSAPTPPVPPTATACHEQRIASSLCEKRSVEAIIASRDTCACSAENEGLNLAIEQWGIGDLLCNPPNDNRTPYVIEVRYDRALTSGGEATRLTNTTVSERTVQRCLVRLAANSEVPFSDENELSVNSLKWLVVHEIGHCLGLGHTNNVNCQGTVNRVGRQNISVMNTTSVGHHQPLPYEKQIVREMWSRMVDDAELQRQTTLIRNNYINDIDVSRGSRDGCNPQPMEMPYDYNTLLSIASRESNVYRTQNMSYGIAANSCISLYITRR